MWIFEASFALNICIKFFVDYHEEGIKNPIQNNTKIAMNYLRTEFIQDLVPTIPFHIINQEKNREHLTNLTKMIRLNTAQRLFDDRAFMIQVKKYYKHRLQNLIAENP